MNNQTTGASEMSKLTKKEADWVAEIQSVLDKCPSKRIEAFTIGDASITLFDKSNMAKIEDNLSKNPNNEWCTAVEETDSVFTHLKFPFAVHSTAG